MTLDPNLRAHLRAQIAAASAEEHRVDIVVNHRVLRELLDDTEPTDPMAEPQLSVELRINRPPGTCSFRTSIGTQIGPTENPDVERESIIDSVRAMAQAAERYLRTDPTH